MYIYLLQALEIPKDVDYKNLAVETIGIDEDQLILSN